MGGLVAERWPGCDRAIACEVLEDAYGRLPRQDNVGIEVQPGERAQQPVTRPEGCGLRCDCQIDHLDGMAAGAGDCGGVVLAAVAHHGYLKIGGIDPIKQVVQASADDRALVVCGDQH